MARSEHLLYCEKKQYEKKAEQWESDLQCITICSIFFHRASTIPLQWRPFLVPGFLLYTELNNANIMPQQCVINDGMPMFRWCDGHDI